MWAPVSAEAAPAAAGPVGPRWKRVGAAWLRRVSEAVTEWRDT